MGRRHPGTAVRMGTCGFVPLILRSLSPKIVVRRVRLPLPCPSGARDPGDGFPLEVEQNLPPRTSYEGHLA